MSNSRLFLFMVLSVVATFGSPDEKQDKAIPPNSKVFVNEMGGYETFLKTALAKKKVPLQVVDNKADADFEITGTADSKKAGAAKIIFTGSWHSTEEASITVTNVKTGVIAFAYSVHKQDSYHGKQSSAEACAKHLKEQIEKIK
jgi:hypothetical protein